MKADNVEQQTLCYQQCNQSQKYFKFKIVAEDLSEIELSITYESCLSEFKKMYGENNDTAYNNFYLLFNGHRIDGEDTTSKMENMDVNDPESNYGSDIFSQSTSLPPTTPIKAFPDQTIVSPNFLCPDETRVSDICKYPSTAEWKNLWLQNHHCSSLDILFKENEEHDHYVYALTLLNEDQPVNKIFYIGETRYPDNRLVEHRADDITNEEKWEIFRNNPRNRIQMVLLWVDTMGKCMVIENLMIQYGHELGLELTNKLQNKYHRDFQDDIAAVLKEIIDFGLMLKIGKNAAEVQPTPEKLERDKIQKFAKRAEQKLNTLNHSESLPSLHSVESLTPPLSFCEQDVDCNLSILQISEELRQKNIDILIRKFMLNGTSIGDGETIIESIPGTFLNMCEIELLKLMEDKNSAIVFAARIGVIANERKCKKCNSYMRLENRTDKIVGIRWRCQPQKYCSSAKLIENTFFDQNNFPLLFQLRLVYYFSKNLSSEEIIERLGDIGNKKAAYNVINDLKSQIIDVELKKLSKNQELSSDILRQIFLADSTWDHFGIILSWIVDNRLQKVQQENIESNSC